MQPSILGTSAVILPTLSFWSVGAVAVVLAALTLRRLAAPSGDGVREGRTRGRHLWAALGVGAGLAFGLEGGLTEAQPICTPSTNPCQTCPALPPCTPSETLCADLGSGGNINTTFTVSFQTCTGSFAQETTSETENAIGPANICIGQDKSVGCLVPAGTQNFNVHVFTILAPSNTPTNTATSTATNTPTASSTPTASDTPPASSTPTSTSTATQTPTASSTVTASITPTASSSPTITNTPAVLPPVVPAIPALSASGAAILVVLLAGLGFLMLTRWRP